MTPTSQVLVVDDDEDDFFFTRRELRKVIAVPILHLESGRAAIDYLAGHGPYADRSVFPFPQVMFLDLKMNQVSGLEVLQWVRANIPPPAPKIFVLTGSNEPRDREIVKHTGVAAGYIVKPLSSAHLKSIFGDTPAAA